MGLFTAVIVGILVLSTTKVLATEDEEDSQLACHCSPVINVSVDGDGRCDLCKSTSQLRKELKELKSELLTVKNQLGRIQPGLSFSSFDLYFTKKGTSDYIIHHGLDVTVAFTICLRIRTTDTTRVLHAVVSYSAPKTFNEILINRFSDISVTIKDTTRQSRVSAIDGKWHHICVSWENKGGSWKLYKDGSTAASGSGFKTGTAIQTNGILIIGQEQDSFGGSFDPTQNYIGELTDLNIWNRVLTAQEILSLSKSCHGGMGNVKKWSDFKVGIRGDVRVITPSACEI